MTLDPAERRSALELMKLSRAVDRYAVGLQRQGVFGTFGEARGQEATLVGAAMALDPAVDWMVPQYRELPALVHHGVPLELLFLLYRYLPAGFTVPTGVNALCNQVSLAAQLPHAVGLAWGLALQKKPGVVLAFVGDGGSSEGDFFEACNLAGVTGAPVVVVVQNNGWAISTPTSRQTRASRIADRASGFGIAGRTVDGNDLDAVHEAVLDAVERARSGGGATLVECLTYRAGAHNTNDDPSRYRDPDEHAERERDDPIERLEGVLRAEGAWNDEREREYTASVRARLDAALDWALAQPEPGADGVFDHVYKNPPARLERQRREQLSGGRE
ncbi:thiamine pyrophosphate-dependent enzyme [Herbiconiux moechotypicola]|uniref:2-oxoisovalerate dehydrogenase subunit alpha n=1 Tax=Herbiconiux moechotypicola TaxID=637393 RepID=A0ABN3DEK3_9MICO|nr:thiamine pyrophosphate-dependent enzyme [Herbiconiux moechotypicola]MCS5729285.1 thiamine pyrophosphate-dependent enzyme [Herbiconiux moechotypicola]